MLKQRITTALVLGVILLAALFSLPLDWFTWLSLFVFGYGALEWSKLAEISGKNAQRAYAALAVVVGAGTYQFYLEGNLWSVTGSLTDNNYNLMFLACIWWAISSFLVLVVKGKVGEGCGWSLASFYADNLFSIICSHNS